jgi:HK97 family phage major capsid protein
MARPIRVAMPGAFPERKTTITTGGLGSGTTGIIMPQRIPGITGLPMQELRIRDLMTVTQMTTGNSFDYVRMLARTNAASPQVEAATKAESTYTWQTVSDTVKTIAHFTNVSRQAIEDVPWLQGTINSELMYGLLLKEEAEILSGDGTGQHIRGLLTQATAYNTALNVTADTKLDKLRHAKLQARLVGLGTFAPDGIVLNPTDMAAIELIKDEAGGANKGRYILGNAVDGTPVKMIWGLPVVESDSIAAGTFLIGAFSTAAQLIDRMAAMVEISWEHASNFTANLATILAEERIGLAVRRPEAFVTGAL